MQEKHTFVCYTDSILSFFSVKSYPMFRTTQCTVKTRTKEHIMGTNYLLSIVNTRERENVYFSSSSLQKNNKHKKKRHTQ